MAHARPCSRGRRRRLRRRPGRLHHAPAAARRNGTRGRRHQVTVAETNEHRRASTATPHRQPRHQRQGRLPDARHASTSSTTRWKSFRTSRSARWRSSSDDPLTVKYTLNEGLEWSDGEPITTDDLLFGWAIASGYFDDATLDRAVRSPAARSTSRIAGCTDGSRPTPTPRRQRRQAVAHARSTTTPFVDWDLVGLDRHSRCTSSPRRRASTGRRAHRDAQDDPRGDADAPVEPQRDPQGGRRLLEHRVRRDVAARRRPRCTSSQRPVHRRLVGAHAVDDARDEREVHAATSSPRSPTLVFRFIGDAQRAGDRPPERRGRHHQPAGRRRHADRCSRRSTASRSSRATSSYYDHLDLSFAASSPTRTSARRS